MSLSDIFNKIEEETKKQLSAIEQEKQDTISELKENNEKRIQDSILTIISNQNKRKDEIKRKMLTTLKMDERNMVLKKKQQILKDVFDSIIERFKDLPDSDHEKFIKKHIRGLPDDIKNDISVVSAKGKKSITEKLFKGKYDNPVIEEGEFNGGFIFRSNQMEINCTIEELLIREYKPELEPEIASLLFQ